MQITIAILMSYISLLCLFESRIPSPIKVRIFWTNAFLFAVIAGFRSGIDMPDYSTYQGLYFEVLDSENTNYFIEPSFQLIALVSNFLVPREPMLLFIIYAFMGVFLKNYLILRFPIPIFLAQLVYLSNFFILHELIQIRAGIATCFLVLTIINLAKHKKKMALFYLSIATFFHLSSFVFFFLFFLNLSSFKVRNVFGFLIISYILYYFKLDPITLGVQFFIENFVFVKSAYFDLERAEEFGINVLGFFILTKIIIILFFLTTSANISITKNIYFNLSFVSFVIGVCAYIGLARFPEIAVRISYTLMFFEVFLIPFIATMFKPRYYGRVMVILFSWTFFIANVYLTQYFSYKII